MNKKWLQERGCPICKEKEQFEQLSFMKQERHVHRHRGWQRLILWIRTGVPVSELLYARKYPKESYLVQERKHDGV